VSKVVGRGLRTPLPDYSTISGAKACGHDSPTQHLEVVNSVSFEDFRESIPLLGQPAPVRE
jgi:hypothetical protein